MNQIQEEDWANDSWAWHTGMRSDHNYSNEDKKKDIEDKKQTRHNSDINDESER